MKKLFLTALLLLGAFALVACNRGGDIIPIGGENGDGVIRIGATAMPHMQVLEYILPKLTEQGFNVELVTFDSFHTPNPALVDGDIDINYFQHRPFLNNFNNANEENLLPVFGVHFEPFRLYAGRLNALENLPNGATIAIPDDPTNEARALNLLESIGLITLHDAQRQTATIETGIAENPHNINFMPVIAASLPSILPDVDFAIINGNFALQGGVTHLGIDGAAELPGSPQADNFTNFVVVRYGTDDHPIIATLIDILASQEVRSFIERTYHGAVVPMQIRP